jgi:hypothetical protein
MFLLLLASVVTGASPPQISSPNYSVKVLQDTRTASSHTCKFEFTNRATWPALVVSVGRGNDGHIAELEFPPVNWASGESTHWPNLSPKGWFEASGSSGPPQAPSVRYSVSWQADSQAAELQPGKSLEFVLRMNISEKIDCDQLHWRMIPRPDESALPSFMRRRVPNTPEEKIDEEAHNVNSQVARGRVIQREPNCTKGYGWCEFEIVFLDVQGRIRKIVEWTEGTRQATSKSSVTLRSIWEWYYETDGSPMLLSGRYEGEPGSTEVQLHLIYMNGGRVIRSLWANAAASAFTPAPPVPRDDVIARGRAKLIGTEKWINSKFSKVSTPNEPPDL